MLLRVPELGMTWPVLVLMTFQYKPGVDVCMWLSCQLADTEAALAYFGSIVKALSWNMEWEPSVISVKSSVGPQASVIHPCPCSIVSMDCIRPKVGGDVEACDIHHSPAKIAALVREGVRDLFRKLVGSTLWAAMRPDASCPVCQICS